MDFFTEAYRNKEYCISYCFTRKMSLVKIKNILTNIAMQNLGKTILI